MNFQSPQLLTDLYSDLRERRLLPLIVVLLAGIVVVPIVLANSSKSAPPPPAAPTAAVVPAKASLPATQVTLADPGVRDYKRRLRGDSPRDPFLPQVSSSSSSGNQPSGASPTSSLVNIGASGGSSSGSSVQLTAEGKAAAAAANGTATGPPASVTSGGSSTVPSSGSRQGSSQSSSQGSKIIFYRLKVRSGLVGGEMTVKDEVGPTTSLPSKSVPALAFLGVTFDANLVADQAYFLVSNGVSLVTGTGECSFGAPCQLVAMKPGDYVDLTWTDGQQYRVKLQALERHTRDNPGNSGALTSSPTTQTGDGSGQAPSGRQRGVSHHFSF